MGIQFLFSHGVSDSSFWNQLVLGSAPIPSWPPSPSAPALIYLALRFLL